MKLYFGNMVTTVTTLMIVSLVGFVGYSISNRSNINFWGRRSLFVLAYGLVICCFAAARDGLDKTIQYTIDGSCNPGILDLCQYFGHKKLNFSPSITYAERIIS